MTPLRYFRCGYQAPLRPFFLGLVLYLKSRNKNSIEKCFEKYIAMSDFGDSFPYKDLEIADRLDDDDKKEEEVNTTRTFLQGVASISYYSGESYEMQNMMHEQSGLPDTSYEETPLLGTQSERQNSWDSLNRWFPRASATNLETSYSKTGWLQVKMFGAGKKVYPLFARDNNTGQQRLNPLLPKEIKNSLGKSAEEIIGEDRDYIREQRQRLAEA